MKRTITLISLIVSVTCFGASTDWGDGSVWDPTFDWSGVKWGKFEMTIRSLPGGGTRQDLLACVEDGWLLIYAHLVIDVTASVKNTFELTFNTEPYMESYHQTWTVAQRGDIVNFDTTHNLNADQYLIHIDPSNPNSNIAGPSSLAMERGSSVYLAFETNEQYGCDPPDSANSSNGRKYTKFPPLFNPDYARRYQHSASATPGGSQFTATANWDRRPGGPRSRAAANWESSLPGGAFLLHPN